MAFTFKLVSLFALVAFSSAASTLIQQRYLEKFTPDYQPEAYESAPADSYQLPPQLPLTFELPREEPAAVPFYSPEPSTVLKAPEYVASQPDYYQSPIPSQDLVAPVETEWNPSNDPKFYYEVPAVVTKEELPTQLYPKKFNKDIHTKDKPLASKPKQEIVLEAIDESQYALKQKELHKTFDRLAKLENQRQQIQAQQTV